MSLSVKETSLISLLNYKPPYVLLGDMNAKSPTWGETSVNDKGKIFDELLIEQDISLLNDNSYTHYHIQTNTYSTIDLSFVLI